MSGHYNIRSVLCRDKKENWDKTNRILLCGEPVLVLDGNDKYLMIGDGQSKCTDLAKIKLDKSINNLVLRYHDGGRFTLDVEES